MLVASRPLLGHSGMGQSLRHQGEQPAPSSRQADADSAKDKPQTCFRQCPDNQKSSQWSCRPCALHEHSVGCHKMVAALLILPPGPCFIVIRKLHGPITSCPRQSQRCFRLRASLSQNVARKGPGSRGGGFNWPGQICLFVPLRLEGKSSSKSKRTNCRLTEVTVSFAPSRHAEARKLGEPGPAESGVPSSRRICAEGNSLIQAIGKVSFCRAGHIQLSVGKLAWMRIWFVNLLS